MTRSALIGLDSLPKEESIFADARQFGLDECEIIERPSQNDSDNGDEKELSPSIDIQNLVADGNKNGYFVATQDKGLSDALRDMTYVPQMWLTKGVLIFDTPSAVSRKASQRDERVKQKTGGGTMTKEESKLIGLLREERNNKRKAENSTHNSDVRKKQKAKGPNPLSCKKKKIEEKKDTSESVKRKRRRRKQASLSVDVA